MNKRPGERNRVLKTMDRIVSPSWPCVRIESYMAMGQQSLLDGRPVDVRGQRKFYWERDDRDNDRHADWWQRDVAGFDLYGHRVFVLAPGRGQCPHGHVHLVPSVRRSVVGRVQPHRTLFSRHRTPVVCANNDNLLISNKTVLTEARGTFGAESQTSRDAGLIFIRQHFIYTPSSLFVEKLKNQFYYCPWRVAWCLKYIILIWFKMYYIQP